MPARKKRSVTKGGASRKRTDRDVNRAIAGGKASAAVVLEERAAQQRKRSRAVATAATARALAAPPTNIGANALPRGSAGLGGHAHGGG